MQWFSINFSRLVVLLLPIDLRKIKTIKYLQALVEPIRYLYQQFLDFRLSMIYENQINGQVINLERVLNDTFDPIERRIYITDGDYFEPPVFYEEWKNKPVIFYAEGDSRNPIYYSVDNADNVVSVNFYVHVPNAVFTEKTRIRALVNKYKAFGRLFEIMEII